MNRSELLDKLAMELDEWPTDIPPPNVPGLWSCHHVWRCQAKGDDKKIFPHEWLQRRTELINCPPDSEAPSWAKWKAQDSDGMWKFMDTLPFVKSMTHRDVSYWTAHNNHAARMGKIPAGHDWRATLTEVKHMEQPHEADARMLDAQLAEDVAKHYKHQYKGIKLDPYRIASIYNMQGGPREQIMKKCLRFTDKGQTEQQVVNEIRSALNRWQDMIDEDAQ